MDRILSSKANETNAYTIAKTTTTPKANSNSNNPNNTTATTPTNAYGSG